VRANPLIRTNKKRKIRLWEGILRANIAREIMASPANGVAMPAISILESEISTQRPPLLTASKVRIVGGIETTRIHSI